MTRMHKIFCAGATCALLAAPVEARKARGDHARAADSAKARPEAAAYLEELERRGLVDKSLATPERLAAEVRAADDELVAGNAALAAARLYGIVEGPRFSDFSDSEDFQDAEYRLGIALHRGGGSDSARRYLQRALKRGPEAPFYEAALRAYVDVCLDARTLPACVADLDRLAVKDLHEEVAYLRGRSAYEQDDFTEAEDELKRVSPRSRFYSSALYLRGVMRVKQKDLRSAEDAFCAIADVKDGDTIRFFIDGRFYALRDLARLALGRIAHEEGRYDDAFYHYFLIPQDSNRLPEALFEAAWSSLQRKEFDLGARLVEELLKQFPNSPKASEARLLFATLQVKTCRFAEAEKGFSQFIGESEPLLGEIDHALADPTARARLAEKLLAREQNEPAGSAPEDRLAQALEIDARFYRLQALARGLRSEAVDAGHVGESWRALEARVAGTKVEPVAGDALDATQLQVRTHALAAEVARAREALRGKRGPDADALRHDVDALEARRQGLAAALERALDLQAFASGGKTGAAQGLAQLVHADTEHAGELRSRVASLSQRLDAASGDLVTRALVDLRARFEDLIRRARLGKIDAVVGQKRKLEKQIENLAAGRFPPEMFGRLHIEGLIRDDEEYWPPEKEIWLDEYENYK